MSKKEPLIEHAQAMLVQKHQTDAAQGHLGLLDSALEDMQALQAENLQHLELMLFQAGTLVEESQVIFDADEEDALLIESSLLVQEEFVSIRAPLPGLDFIEMDGGSDWRNYLDQVASYAQRHQIEIGQDPFRDLMSTSQRIALEKRIRDEFSFKGVQCDKYDYMIAGTCGLIGGLVDVLFVGLPGQGSLTQFTDDMTDKAVEKFASWNGWKGPREGKNPTASAIGFLERKYKVNYDHRHGGDVDGLFAMSTRNHHIKSLAHSPDLVGLFFSILDQFTSTAHFVDGGRLISVDTDTFELKGSNLVAKLFCGFINWLGHLFSDVAGSSGAQQRGSGIPIPFFSLLQFINVGEFGQHKQTFAKVAVQVFEQGYDLRHGLAMAIPVLLSELLTRVTWVVKQRFYHQKDWSECIPSASNPELRRMLLVAHGTLCLVDGADAAIRSGGDMIQFMLRSNLIAWVRFGTLALKELNAWYKEGKLDVSAVDSYLDGECERLLAS
ncbi:hypothetical protein FXN65_17625 [Metapseudomonas lalkuanensis]|uniref:Uncharacterized protein n=1 Tax=Metapseudomonas lalkuanensis TaxID=2604832 RepID=A0A5J6QQX8_9GAMM|nr:hypothetical protein [Pseudomonas lalkuanensis]QEY63781.1 hypothetical protein FXN65_17625 [Pseudomonas lalkuanensis]